MKPLLKVTLFHYIISAIVYWCIILRSIHTFFLNKVSRLDENKRFVKELNSQKEQGIFSVSRR